MAQFKETITLAGATNSPLSTLLSGFNVGSIGSCRSWHLRSLGASTAFTPLFQYGTGHDATTVNNTTVVADIAGVADWNINAAAACVVEIIGFAEK